MYSYYSKYLHNDDNGIIWEKELYKRLDDSKCLEQYGFKVYSQNDEDGIIEEIFNRIGCKSKKFVEFGVQDGLESNGHYLLMKGWSGLWIECDEEACKKINCNFETAVNAGKLRLICNFITRDNINDLIVEGGMEEEIDLLSIDIDGNDYHVWEAISCVSPRVVVIEYNAKFPPSCEWIMPYCEQHMWDESDKHGASLLALYNLGKRKGYTLVGTNISGVNAFFVKDEYLQDHFAVMDVEKLYNPPRFQKRYYVGHPSRYFLNYLPEGRMQLFANHGCNIIYKNGFHAVEDISSDCRWMADRKADIWILDSKNKIQTIKIDWANIALAEHRECAPGKLLVTVENMDAISIKLDKEQDRQEFLVKRDKCANDGVLCVHLEIDKLWCPARCSDSMDTRNLGLLLKSIDCE